MAESNNDLPQHNELMWPTLKAIKALGGSAHISEILSKVAEIEGFSEEAQSIPHVSGNQTRLGYRLAWARTWLKNGGAIENSDRGVWSLTDKGEKLKKEQISEIVKQVKLAQSRRKKPDANQKDHVIRAEFLLISTPEDNDNGIGEEEWKNILLDMLINIPPDAFERLAQRILRESNFTTVEVTGRSGDGGIDGTGILQLNLITFLVAFQCKRYQGSVGPGDIRDFRGAVMGRCEKGLFITTGTFTNQATKEARRDGALAIDLVDGSRLCELLKSLALGVKTETVEKITIEYDWFAGL